MSKTPLGLAQALNRSPSPPAEGGRSSAKLDLDSYCSASSTLSLDARRAGRIAASIPATTAAMTKTASEPYGIAKMTPSSDSAVVTSAARKRPTPMPRVAPISVVTIASCRIIRRTCLRVIPTARSMPSSRVRSKTESTSVLTMPNRLTITDSASRP